MREYNLMYAADAYKFSHIAQYPKDVTHVFSTLVARGAKYNDKISATEFYWFGTRLCIEKLRTFERWFFALEEDAFNEVLYQYTRFCRARLGPDYDTKHWRRLYELGFLPLLVHAKPEFTVQGFQTPLMTFENTHEDFAWLTSFVETTVLANIWSVTTAANRAWHIRKTIEDCMHEHSAEDRMAIDFMGHDFSYRGMSGDEAAILAGCGHLSVFKGSDTMIAAKVVQDVYDIETGFSVPATEHSVMCADGQDDELATYNRILDVYPTGIVSIVSDTWDYFQVLTEFLPLLKDRILARDGKVVIRPDSGDPVKIICGDPDVSVGSPAYDGSLELMGRVFGTTTDSAGLKLLNPKVGLIYGDGMNQERIERMLRTMVAQDWSPLNMVFGIGAYTYQFMTRDELGFAFKATAVKRSGEWHAIQKNPKTDPGKRSLSGVFRGDGLERIMG